MATFPCFLFFWAVLVFSVVHSEPVLNGTIILSAYRRLRFAFDIFSVELPQEQLSHGFPITETRLTFGDGTVINHNGFFAAEDLILKDKAISHVSSYVPADSDYRVSMKGNLLAYVSERDGVSEVYFNLYTPINAKDGHGQKSVINEYKVILRRSLNEATVDDDDVIQQQVFLQDRPSFSGDCVIYMSSQERPVIVGSVHPLSWIAVYSTNLTTGETRRLTPLGVADFSPSISPSGQWVLVASYGPRPWLGEIHELNTDLYIFHVSDGSRRKLLTSNGGWPSWGADDSTFFFHRKSEDGWWSIFKGTISTLEFTESLWSDDLLSVERVTPPGIHCFTPAASPTGNWVAVATRRPESVFRHIEIYDLVVHQFFPVTNSIAPNTNHYNPFVSYDSAILGYHRCRGGAANSQILSAINQVDNASMSSDDSKRRTITEGTYKCEQSHLVPHLNHVRSPVSGLSVLRTDGEFPSFSPDGSLVAYICKAGETGVRVMRSDGSGSTEVYSERSFGTVWDVKREGVIYTSSGPIFHSRSSVHIVAIFNVHRLVNGEKLPLTSKTLTKEGTLSNAFPWPSPDGKYLVFRSSRSGSKNLYIIDAVNGEEGGLWRLTNGKWTDTMCSWSPDGQWIAFSSDRENPRSGSFSLFVIHPNGTGLRKVLSNTDIVGGLMNHASFSPDSKSLVFTTNYAGLSAEPISTPFQFQAYGDIFVVSLDGSKLERITHSSFENGTPSWGRKTISSLDLSSEGENVQCCFDDLDWLEEHSIMQTGTQRLQRPCSAAGLTFPLVDSYGIH